MERPDGRKPDQLRPVKIERNFIKYAEGSVLITVGDTKVVCTATIEDKVPQFLRGLGEGWITAEYGMLPGDGKTCEASEKAKRRTYEIHA